MTKLVARRHGLALALTLAVIAVIALGSSGCSIDTRSDALRCDTPADCLGNLTCQGGWCLAPVVPDARPCDPPCTMCLADGTCVIDCANTQDCAAQVQCPAGIPCTVQCNGDQSCAMGVDCTQATACDIQCDGISSCAGAITCGGGTCAVECSGQNSCTDAVNCANSCACDTVCSGTLACDGITHACPATGNCQNGGVCRSNTGGCDSC